MFCSSVSSNPEKLAKAEFPKRPIIHFRSSNFISCKVSIYWHINEESEQEKKHDSETEGRRKWIFVSYWHQSPKTLSVADTPFQFADEAQGHPRLTFVSLPPSSEGKSRSQARGTQGKSEIQPRVKESSRQIKDQFLSESWRLLFL